MAEGFIQLPPDSTGKKARTEEFTVGANDVHMPVEVAADPAGNLLDGSGRVQGVAHPPAAGTAGGSVTASGGGRVMNVWAYANGADGTVTYQAGPNTTYMAEAVLEIDCPIGS